MTGTRWMLLLVCAPFLGMTLACSKEIVEADLILHHGKVWTVDDARPLAEAVALRGKEILKVGSNDEVLALEGTGTRTLDLEGKLVLPGFNDAHLHFENATEWFFEVRLFDVNGPDEMVRRLRDAAARVPEGLWITGGEWSAFDAWKARDEGNRRFTPFLPSKELIDPVTPNHPVLLKRYDGVYLANSKALEYARIGKHKADPAGGEYVRDPRTGELTGILTGRAGDRMARLLPPKSMARTLIGARDVLARLRKFGITSIQDIARLDEASQEKIYHTHVERSFSDLNIFLELRRRGELTCRVYPILALAAWKETLDHGIRPGSGDDLIRYGALKAFIDGTYMLEPYTNNPDYAGDFTFRFLSEEAMAKDILEADRAGFDPAIHVLGDRAHHLLLNWYEAAMKSNPPRDRRFRLIHAEYITPEDMDRAGHMGLIADVTPFHLIKAFDGIEDKFGKERAGYAFAYRSLIDRGLRLNLVSDFPGSYYKLYSTPLNPMVEMYHAVTRKDLEGDPPGGWHPEQCMTIREAIEAYTINPAYSSYEELRKGTITEGKLADLVVLSRDILTCDPHLIPSTEVELTVFDGKIVYEKP